ncbi:MAG: serine/threonine-protein kinase [bacterium]
MNDDRTPPSGPEEDLTLPLGPADGTAPGEAIGAQIGPYRLIHRIGEGGMGEVFEAEQSEPIRRRVALKVIKQGMDTQSVIARFDAERQALAMMDHPCIAKVFDAGATERGRPFFVMEYVDGEPITDYCNRRRLNNTARLELFVRVCEGVQHAHQKAVIHRDLKPTNILVTEVDGLPLPKIIDFGLAKATTQRLTEMTMFTQLGQMIGTPEYMSPEQAALSEDDVDTRTDVYALGVVLYELLAGVRPFESQELRKAGYEAIRRIICEQDPPRPSTRFSSLGEKSGQVAASHGSAPKRLQGELRGDLDWITMKALEKDRNRRYETANGLAADVRRHLRNEPVIAGPPTVGYRTSKFVRRHRTGVAIAAVAVLGLAAFAVTSSLQAGIIARERDRAEAEAAKAAAMNAFLTETLASADPWSGGDREATVVQALDVAVKKIDTAFAGQPEVEASMRGVIGQTYLGLGKLEPAGEQIEAAVAMRRELGGPDQLELATLLLVQSEFREDAAEYGPGAASAAEAVGILLRHPETPPQDLINAYLRQARNLLSDRRFAEAESLLTLARDLEPRLQGVQRISGAENLTQLANLYNDRDGDVAAADSFAQMAYDLARSVDPLHPSVPVYLNNLAQFRSQNGDREGALAAFDSALVLYRDRFGSDHPEYAVCLENRGGVLYQLGRTDETFAALEEVMDVRKRNLGPDHIDVVRTGLNVGTVAMIVQDYDRSLEIFRDLKPRLIAARGSDHPDVLTVLRNEGMTLRSLDRNDEALGVQRELLDTALRMHGEDNPATALARLECGITLTALRRHAEAERQLIPAFEVFLATLGADHVRTKYAARSLVALFEQTGEAGKADRYREAAGE